MDSSPLNQTSPVPVSKQTNTLTLLVIVLLIVLIAMLGFWFYQNDFFVEKFSDTQTGSQLPTNTPQGSVGNEVGFEEARAMIQAGIEKWDALEYITYTKAGIKDEVGDVQVSYQMDFVNDEYYITESFYRGCTEPPSMYCTFEQGYIKKDGKYYKYDIEAPYSLESLNYIEVEEEEMAGYSGLQGIKESLEIIMETLKYNIVATKLEGMYKGGKVKYLVVHSYKDAEANGLLDRFKVQADITHDSYLVEAVINSSGEIIEIGISYDGYYKETYRFNYNEPVSIELPVVSE